MNSHTQTALIQLFVKEFTDKKGKTYTYIPSRATDDSINFLLEYYVMGIFPQYEIKHDKIILYLRVYLKEVLE